MGTAEVKTFTRDSVRVARILAARRRLLEKEHGRRYSQSAVADVLGVGANMVNMYERYGADGTGTGRVPLDRIVELSAFYGWTKLGHLLVLLQMREENPKAFDALLGAYPPRYKRYLEVLEEHADRLLAPTKRMSEDAQFTACLLADMAKFRVGYYREQNEVYKELRASFAKDGLPEDEIEKKDPQIWEQAGEELQRREAAHEMMVEEWMADRDREAGGAA